MRNRLFNRYRIEPGKAFVSSELEALDMIYAILTCASKARSLARSSGKNVFTRDRSEYISDFLSAIEIKELFNKDARNTVEHFDKYLDNANTLHTKLVPPEKYLVAYNFVLSHMWPDNKTEFPWPMYRTHIWPLPIYPVRIYVVSDRCFYNFETVVDLGKLREEAELIIDQIRASIGQEKPEDWMSVAMCFGPPENTSVPLMNRCMKKRLNS